MEYNLKEELSLPFISWIAKHSIWLILINWPKMICSYVYKQPIFSNCFNYKFSWLGVFSAVWRIGQLEINFWLDKNKIIF